MYTDSVYIGKNKLDTVVKPVQGNIVTIEGEKYFKISNFSQMKPFFMNIVSESDLWMFISSNGALTAGRKNPDNALFPYYTDDRIHDSQDVTGSKTIVLVQKDDRSFLWEPFSAAYQGIYHTESNIYKNMAGNRLIFEQINLDLSVSFSYSWMNCDRYGFIRKSHIRNMDSKSIGISVVDGIMNILPYGADRKFQLEYSTLLDAYKKNELLQDYDLALYTLSSIPTDKAEPSEALKATVVWSIGTNHPTILLSMRQLELFKMGKNLQQEKDVTAERGAYLVQSDFDLPASKEKEWYIVADLNKDQADVAQLKHVLKNNQGIVQSIESEIEKSTEKLKIKVAQADGYQLTNDQLKTFRHFSNTLFNIMRGGIFDDNYYIDPQDFQDFIKTTNKDVLSRHEEFFALLKDKLTITELNAKIRELDDPVFEKLEQEYLPITFSRRHGDPSRPWNYFSIDIKDDTGERVLNYQGNWRDIFQNWEALALSFPGYIEKMITKFVNASTADGYNPYRVTRDGFDWEVLDPDDSWSYIGYWGDHQIVYLTRLLQISAHYHPEMLNSLLTREIFAYSNVPYRIKPIKDIIKDPHNTIDFDYELHNELVDRVNKMGTDGKYILNDDKDIYFVNLAEKLLVTLFVKLSNFIPGAGIWMNTQRPEWNDANNALVGYGASMVTLYYLRKYVIFIKELFNHSDVKLVNLSDIVLYLFNDLDKAFNDHLSMPEHISDSDRYQILMALGKAGSKHRSAAYANEFNGKRDLDVQQLVSFLDRVLGYVDQSIRENKRNDHLYHAYNLIKIENETVSVRNLYEMLEGQVAVLSSGILSIEESVQLLEALKNSSLYRKDQFSYLLYPNRKLAGFEEKNIIPQDLVQKSGLLEKMVRNGDTCIVVKNREGYVHFNSNFRNAEFLRQALHALGNGEQTNAKEEAFILSIYESVFDHQSFTGRSGTFYKYEGLGSIYWHMVSKLLLAVQEILLQCKEKPELLERLEAFYFDIQHGIGVHKSPDLYGAFPTDPYSHTPAHAGVQQPGMTGQVKEDIISRFGELGAVVRDGILQFDTTLLNKDEFLNRSQVFEYYDVNGKRQTLMLNPGMLGFTVCQIPVVYIQANVSKVIVTLDDEKDIVFDDHKLDVVSSRAVFERTDKIKKIQVLIHFE